MLAVIWVVLVVVVIVDGAGFVGVRRCGSSCWSRIGWPRDPLAPPAWRYPTGFAGVSFATVLGLVVGWLACCLLVDDFGVDGAGFSCVRGCGYVRWPRTGSWCWPSLWSMVCSTRVFDGVGVVAGRGLGHGEGCTCGRPAGLQTCSTVFDDVDVLGGWCLVRGAGRCWCRWCVPQECSTLWV